MISYEPFWKTLKEKKISQYKLQNIYCISAGQLSRMRARQNISTHTINTFCEILDCQVSDIIMYVKKDGNNQVGIIE